MNRIIQICKLISLVGIVSLFLSSVLAFILGASKVVQVSIAVATSLGKDPLVLVTLIQIMDVFLIATALFIFAISLYEMFIGELDLPEGMVARNLYDLKAKLGSVLVLFMTGTFAERLVKGGDAQDLMYTAIAVTLVSGAIIALGSLNKSA